MKHYLTRKNRAFAASMAVASILSIWYAIGYFLTIIATHHIMGAEKILEWVPQFNFLFILVSPRALPIAGFDFFGFMLGLLQIYITAKLITWLIVITYERIHRNR